MDDFEFMLIKIAHRTKEVPDVQAVLTDFGCNIKMRLGLHEAGDVCSSQGLILLQLTGDEKELSEFEQKLNAIAGVTAKRTSI